jgi:chondroitin 4-sulfotransferase 11
MAAFGIRKRSPDWDRFNNGVLSDTWEQRSPAEREYFVFSVVRNPFDKAISAWKYLKAVRNRPLIEVLENPPRAGFAYRHMFRPQKALLCRPDGSLIVNDLIRYESLQSDFDRICDKLGKSRQLLPHLNASERDKDYRAYFDKPARKLAEALFADDLKAFHYGF